MTEFIITFAVILFFAFSVTMGARLKKRTTVADCHCESQADLKEAASPCQLCGAIGSCNESNDLGIEGFRN